MENVAPTPIDKLQPYVRAAKIKVRICRIWKSTIPGTVQKYTALHCILLDEMQHAIEACTTEMDYEIVASKIEAGSYYEIMCFRTNRMRGQYRVVPHDTQVVFTGKTITQVVFTGKAITGLGAALFINSFVRDGTGRIKLFGKDNTQALHVGKDFVQVLLVAFFDLLLFCFGFHVNLMKFWYPFVRLEKYISRSVG